MYEMEKYDYNRFGIQFFQRKLKLLSKQTNANIDVSTNIKLSITKVEIEKYFVRVK